MTSSEMFKKNKNNSNNIQQPDAPIDNDETHLNQVNLISSSIITTTNIPPVRKSLLTNESEEETWSSAGLNSLNPFVHRIKFDGRIDLAKIYVLTVLLLPIRVVGCVLSLISAWMFACIGLYGITLEDLKKAPLTGWRKQMKTVVAAAMRMVYASGSFQYIKFKGVRATAKEAPILVVAPHSSYADSITVVCCGPPSIVAKQETSQIPLIGKIINYSQPIYVQREDPNSRQNTIREIVARARSTDEWPQVLIFAEGTCTNRSALIKFKPGAFYAGVPVQPVLLKYPNKNDTFTWTWDGPGVWKLLWLTLAQFHNHCEIEFLPVYTPNEEEKKNANLYANNVRTVMANALGVPTSEYSFEDVIMMSRAKDMKIPFPGDIVEIERIIEKMGLLKSNLDIELSVDFIKMSHTDKMDFITFSELLKVDANDANLHNLFAVLDHRKRGIINLRSFLICSIFCKNVNQPLIKFLSDITNLYSESTQSITRENFWKIIRHTGKITPNKSDALYLAIDTTNKGFISFAEFESHTKELPEYKYLYTSQEQIRRTHEKK